MWILNETGTLAINDYGIKIYVGSVGSRKQEKWEIRIVGHNSTETLATYTNEDDAKARLREFAVSGNTTFFPSKTEAAS